MPLVIALVVVLMAAGLAGSVLPFMPGTPLIFLGALVYGFATGFEVIGTWRLVVLGLLVGVTYALDYAAGALGARKLGGSRWAALGALCGGLIGIFFGLPGVLLGPVVGAIGFELAYRKQVSAGLKSGAGAVVGMVLGGVAKLSLATVMVGLFAFWAIRG